MGFTAMPLKSTFLFLRHSARPSIFFFLQNKQFISKRIVIIFFFVATFFFFRPHDKVQAIL